MDDELSALRRAVAANPDDPAAVRRLEAALRRSDRTRELRLRYRVKYRCPLDFWKDLTATDDPAVRHCAQCDRPVHLVTSAGALRDRVAEGACVAVAAESIDVAIDGLVEDPRCDSAEEAAAPCVVAHRRRRPRPITMMGRVSRL